jgi:hypothetical protein
MTLSEKDLQELLWRDISIIELPSKEWLLILLCKDQEQSNNLMNALKKNPFDMKIFIDKDGKYKLTLDFINSEYTIGNDTHKTAADYPPLTKLSSSQVKYLSTGISLGGGQLSYRQDFIELGRIIMN